MALYSVETRVTPVDAIGDAVAYFGPGGLGLEVTQQDACCACFEGGGGHIYVTATAGTKTTVALETREWDYHVRQFMRDIARS
jgi:hypothetical protein